MKRKRFVQRFEVFVPASATGPARMLLVYASKPERALARLRTWGVGLTPADLAPAGAYDRHRNVVVDETESVGDPPSGVRELPSCAADQVVTSGPVVGGTGK